MNAYPLDTWQADCLTVAMSIDERLQWRSFEVAVRVPRQQGKGDILQARALFEVLVVSKLFGARTVFHTAHELQTAEDAHARLVALIGISPSLQRRVTKINQGSGKKSIEFVDGSIIKYRSRSSRGGRGLQGDLIIFDEDLYLDATMLGALLPTLLTRTNPQVIYAGSGLFADSKHAHAVRERALATDEPDPDLAYVEYSLPVRQPNGQPTNIWDEDGWVWAAPALRAGRIDRALVRKSMKAMGEIEAAREYLCISAPTTGLAVIADDLWEELTDRDSQITGTVRYALEVDRDRTHASIGVAGRRADGRWHLEVAHRQDGTDWIVDWLNARAGEVGELWLNPGGGAAGLLPDLIEAKIPVHPTTPREFAAACGRMYDLTVDRKDVRHIGQPSLNASVSAGRKRYTTDAWVWHRQSQDDDLTALVAVTLALYAASLDAATPAKPAPIPNDPDAFVDRDADLPMQMRW